MKKILIVNLDEPRKEVKLKIVTPEISNDKISNDLRNLTKLLIKKGIESNTGILGGQYGYGVNYKNKVFEMNQFCWCDKDDCELCSGKKPNFLHKKSKFKISWYKWLGRGMEHKNISNEKWDKIINECVKSI